MKREGWLAVLLLPIFALAMGQNGEVLPERGAEFLERYFPTIGVDSLYWGQEFSNDVVGVLLADGTEVEFDERGEWREVSNVTKGVAVALLEEVLDEAVKTLIRGYTVTKISAEKCGYDLKLSNGIKVKTTQHGECVEGD